MKLKAVATIVPVIVTLAIVGIASQVSAADSAQQERVSSGGVPNRGSTADRPEVSQGDMLVVKTQVAHLKEQVDSLTAQLNSLQSRYESHQHFYSAPPADGTGKIRIVTGSPPAEYCSSTPKPGYFLNSGAYCKEP